MKRTFQITLSGQVQGVGFRPFVYGVARKYRFEGTVCNHEAGVKICINATKRRAKAFLEGLLEEAPAISLVQNYVLKEVPFVDYKDFSIIHSQADNPIKTPLTPDFAICDSCKQEITNPKNRRFQYPFTTCVNCGPRYAITTRFPFERNHTTIARYTLCQDCSREYANPLDRRFHAQTNSCATCGIRLTLTDAKGTEIEADQLLRKTANLIVKGYIVAIKNTGGYLLCCDAQNSTTLKRLRMLKGRPAKPFALLYPSIEMVNTHYRLSRQEKKALTSSVAPIVLLTPKTALPLLARADIAPGLKQLGVMLPSSALLELLMQKIKKPIVATSGNLHGAPLAATDTEAMEQLHTIADYFLHHNLEITFPQDDSLLRFSGEQQLLLRRSRGMAPNYLGYTTDKEESILAMGAHLKSTFTFSTGTYAYVSQYFGDLDHYDVLKRYTHTLNRYIEIFETRPETILIDSHPQYQSSILGKELAARWNVEAIKIQHHKAHLASVLGEHQLFDIKDKVLGVIWDGAGLGEDNTIWGGDFFVYQDRRITRLTHLDYFDWIAGEKMAKEPRLSLLGLLSEEQREYARDKFSETEWNIYTRMLQNNSLKTTSMGRLFDAVASLLDIKDKITYEGEAAMLLESVATRYTGHAYIDFLTNESYDTVPVENLLSYIMEAKQKGFSVEKIAAGFIHTLAKIIVNIATKNNLKYIVCSGGVFQNGLLVDRLMHLTRNTAMNLKINCNLPTNDENISLGQLFYYRYIKE